MIVPIQVKLNTSRPRQYGQHFPDDISKCIFLNENVNNSITFWQKFVPKILIGNHTSFGSDNGLVLKKRHAIILTNDGLVWWRIYTSLGPNENMRKQMARIWQKL